MSREGTCSFSYRSTGGPARAGSAAAWSARWTNADRGPNDTWGRDLRYRRMWRARPDVWRRDDESPGISRCSPPYRSPIAPLRLPTLLSAILVSAVDAGGLTPYEAESRFIRRVVR